MPATSLWDHPWILCQVHGLCALAWCCDLANKSERPKVAKGLTLGGNLPFWYKPGERSPGVAVKGRKLCAAFSPQQRLNYGKLVLNKFLFRGTRMKAKQTCNDSRITGKFRDLQRHPAPKDSFKDLYSQAGKSQRPPGGLLAL